MRPARSVGAHAFVCALASASTLAGCGEETLGQKVDRLTDEAKQAGREALDETAKTVSDKAGEAADWVAQKHASGELSDAALGAMKTAGEGIASVASTGAQLAPVALELGQVLYEVVDKDIEIEPIYQAIDDADKAEALDEDIGDMPRVETIDGLEVGFKDVSSSDAGKRSSASAYLVLWRQGDHLVGFIYRSASEIDIERFMQEAPRLIEKARAATAEGATP